MRVEDTMAPIAMLSQRRSLYFRWAVLGCSLGLGSGLLGCGSGGAESGSDSPAAATSADPSNAGSVSLALDVGNAHLSAVNYAIIGGQFHTAGVLDVSHSASISGTIGGIPFGSDYVVTLTATSADTTPVMSCDGSASFAISSSAPVHVPVHVACRQQKVLAATPAPLPPTTPFALGLLLLGIGIWQQRRKSAPHAAG